MSTNPCGDISGALRAKASDHLIEKVGAELRKMMAWNRPAEEATAAQAKARA
jgi:ketol-acid reductoisomerase